MIFQFAIELSTGTYQKYKPSVLNLQDWYNPNDYQILICEESNVSFTGDTIDITQTLTNIEATPESSSDVMELGAIPTCLLYTSPSPRDLSTSRMPSSA